MPGLLGIGNVVVDVYRDDLLAYPGGNALNVAVYHRLLHSSPAGFIGLLGTDRYSDHITDVSSALGVDVSRSRRVVGETGRTLVDISADGDRVFAATNRGGVQAEVSLRLNEDDLELVDDYDFVHTSVYAGLDPQIPALAARTRVAYDFSAPGTRDVDLSILEHIECAFFSASDMSEPQREEFVRTCFDFGATTVILTAGVEGAYGYTREETHHQPSDEAELVDALGAGDGFISGFLHSWQRESDLRTALRSGARSGAEACGFRGAFGHPLPATRDEMAALLRNPV